MWIRAIDFDLTYVFEYLWNFLGSVVGEMKLWTFTVAGHTVSIFSLSIAVAVLWIIITALPVIGNRDQGGKKDE